MVEMEGPRDRGFEPDARAYIPAQARYEPTANPKEKLAVFEIQVSGARRGWCVDI